MTGKNRRRAAWMRSTLSLAAAVGLGIGMWLWVTAGNEASRAPSSGPGRAMAAGIFGSAVTALGIALWGLTAAARRDEEDNALYYRRCGLALCVLVAFACTFVCTASLVSAALGTTETFSQFWASGVALLLTLVVAIWVRGPVMAFVAGTGFAATAFALSSVWILAAPILLVVGGVALTVSASASFSFELDELR